MPEASSQLGSCKDFVNSTYSLAAIGIKKNEDRDSDSCHMYSRNSLYPTDEENNMYRSHSSSINSSSYLSLNSRKLSLAKSSNTLFERLEDNQCYIHFCYQKNISHIK